MEKPATPPSPKRPKNTSSSSSPTSSSSSNALAPTSPPPTTTTTTTTPPPTPPPSPPPISPLNTIPTIEDDDSLHATYPTIQDALWAVASDTTTSNSSSSNDSHNDGRVPNLLTDLDSETEQPGVKTYTMDGCSAGGETPLGGGGMGMGGGGGGLGGRNGGGGRRLSPRPSEISIVCNSASSGLGGVGTSVVGGGDEGNGMVMGIDKAIGSSMDNPNHQDGNDNDDTNNEIENHNPSDQTILPNLHQHLKSCAWDDLRHQLDFLAMNPDVILPTLCRTNGEADGGTVLHTACWKAPSDLVLKMMALVPEETETNEAVEDDTDGKDGGDGGGGDEDDKGGSNEPTPTGQTTTPDPFTILDHDHNTPLHLCCANLSPFYPTTTTNNNNNNSSRPTSSSTATTHSHHNINNKPSHQPILDLSVLTTLLQRSPQSLSIPNTEGDTPLHLFLGSPTVSYSDDTSETASLTVLRSILDRLPSPSLALTQDSTGATPLHVAIANGANHRLIMELLRYGPGAVRIEDRFGMLPLHYVGAFLSSSLKGRVVETMISLHPGSVVAQTENGDTPLHLCVRKEADERGKTRGEMEANAFRMYENVMEIEEETREVVGLLICTESERGFGGEEREEEDGEGSGVKCALLVLNNEKLTPLHCCALFKAPLKLTKLLMAHPYALRTASMQNAFGATALHLAVAQQSAGTFCETALAVGTHEAAVVQDKLKRTPLHVAAQNIHATGDLIQGLVELNSIACTKKTERGHLPLHIAAQSQAKEPVVEALISAFPAGAEMKNRSNNTPLHDAAKYHAGSGVVELLLKQYPQAVYIQNQYGNLPLHCATAYQAPSLIVGLLLQAWPHGASIQNRNEDCPLHYAAAYATSVDALKLLVDAAPASVLLLNSAGESPIAKAKANDAPEEIIQMLEKAGEEWTRKALEDGWGDFGE